MSESINFQLAQIRKSGYTDRQLDRFVPEEEKRMIEYEDSSAADMFLLMKKTKQKKIEEKKEGSLAFYKQ